MVFTVQDLLIQRVLPNLKLIAGNSGLNKEILAVNSAEILCDPDSFHTGELIFTTGYDMDQEEKYRRLLPKLAQQEICGIVVLVGRYLDDVPLFLTTMSDQLGLPLMTLPCSVTLPRILRAILPLISPSMQQAWDDRTISQARTFFVDSLTAHEKELYPLQDDQLVRLVLLEGANYANSKEQQWKEAFQQVRSFIQANTYFCAYQELSKNQYAFLIAHKREDSPSMMYRLHLQFIALSESIGINYLLGNDYCYSAEQLDATLLRATEGLNTLHLTKAKRGVCTYESIRFIKMLSYLRRDDSSVFLENQALKLLFNHDRQNHTDYMDTLRIYLSSNCNIARTSKMLFIHRNTLINRLDKIATISGLRMEDYYQRTHIAIALMFHDYFAA